MPDINEELLEALERIVSYYDDPRCGNEARGLPGMEYQAKARHESTMFGAARAAIAKARGVQS